MFSVRGYTTKVRALELESDDAKDVEAMRRALRQKERDLEARKAEVRGPGRPQ